MQTDGESLANNNNSLNRGKKKHRKGIGNCMQQISEVSNKFLAGVF